MENPIKMDDLGGTTIFGNIHKKGIGIPGILNARGPKAPIYH